MAPSDFYPPSLHDALPIYRAPGPLAARGVPAGRLQRDRPQRLRRAGGGRPAAAAAHLGGTDPHGGGLPLLRLVVRSEEHTSELQSRENLVCRLLLEKNN